MNSPSSKAIAFLLTAAAFMGLACTASASLIVTLDHDDRGWYRSNGTHSPVNTNYTNGGIGNNEYRNFFVFDLSGVSGTILSAYLHLAMPNNGYRSPDSTETYRVQDVTTSIASLIAGTGGVAAFNDLGSGTVFGSQTVQNSDEGGFVDVTLNSSALTELNAATGQWAVGGNISTLNAIPDLEYAFAFSNGTQTTQLVLLTAVPEPTTFLPLLGLIAGAVMFHRPRRQRDT